MTHDELVLRAGKWLKSFGCSVVLRELVAFTASGEIPDAIGWKGGRSILIECKASRTDFLADKKKTFRVCPDIGIGANRLYMCPPEIINPGDLPDGWGLLWVRGRRVERKVGPKGNYFTDGDGIKTFHKRSMQGEVALLVSAMRRLGKVVDMELLYESNSRASP